MTKFSYSNINFIYYGYITIIAIEMVQITVMIIIIVKVTIITNKTSIAIEKKGNNKIVLLMYDFLRERRRGGRQDSS